MRVPQRKSRKTLVVIPFGTYAITEPLEIPDGVMLTGLPSWHFPLKWLRIGWYWITRRLIVWDFKEDA